MSESKAISRKMLFGVKLQNEIFPPWKEYYIRYDLLKKLLRENVVLDASSAKWSEKDESAFAAQLDRELEKVYGFQSGRYAELDTKISALEALSEEFLESYDQKVQQKTSNFDVKKFQAELENTLAMAQELDHFARLNFTGFVKIVKKHDRLHKKYSVKALLNVRLKSLPFHSEDYSPYLFRLSVLYQFLRDNFSFDSSSLSSSLGVSMNNRLSSSEKIGSVLSIPQNHPGVETYKVLKFWVHPDNLMEIKTTILRHLPVLIYNNSADDDADHVSDPTMTSVYFDNQNFELYNTKLLKNLNKTPSFRIRWSGKLADNPDLTLEKKTFNYDTGESSDVRLVLKEKYVNDFISIGAGAGSSDDAEDAEPDVFASKKNLKLDLKRYTRKLEKRGLSRETVERYAAEYNDLHSFIEKSHLQPVLRTIYTRTAFQIPGDDKVRIIIDSNILFIREDSFDAERPIRDPRDWHRKDIDANIDNPYSLLRKGEYAKFPYSVMEIKISQSILNNPDSKTFKWISDLINGHLVKEVPNFSKFIQGISSLFLEDDNLDILPFWLPELEHDIRKNPEQAYKDTSEKLKKQKLEDESLKNLKRSIASPNITSGSPRPVNSLDQITELGESEADLDDNESSDDEYGEEILASSTTPISQAAEPISSPLRKKSNGRSFASLGAISKLDGESEDEEVVLPPGVTKPKTLLRQSGPVRVEAKVWLANERTFVRWLHVTTMFSALTFVIYSSVQKSHFPTLATSIAYIYFGLTLFSGIWAYGLYNYRLKIIRLREGNHLDRIEGPLLIGAILLVTLALEFYSGFKTFKAKRGIASVFDQSFDIYRADFVPDGLETENLHPFNAYALEFMMSLVN
ncbi:unnamed protein product [Kuraishia capsulata CBS 1993]|uniref:SPX domain-containing protein n=1 Tax=Kuraishia capsulata CBS 1993 TaxID=1382522 RepID=W6MNK6_9ASCO|nr:uncharacterized protein KUCA_T00004231001 [Kuraishia capsulata CBS 1993]CDK28249.1 unnamed protein product [Kuraishia capsulata CBS 1993]